MSFGYITKHEYLENCNKTINEYLRKLPKRDLRVTCNELTNSEEDVQDFKLNLFVAELIGPCNGCDGYEYSKDSVAVNKCINAPTCLKLKGTMNNCYKCNSESVSYIGSKIAHPEIQGCWLCIKCGHVEVDFY